MRLKPIADQVLLVLRDHTGYKFEIPAIADAYAQRWPPTSKAKKIRQALERAIYAALDQLETKGFVKCFSNVKTAEQLAQCIAAGKPHPAEDLSWRITNTGYAYSHAVGLGLLRRIAQIEPKRPLEGA